MLLVASYAISVPGIAKGAQRQSAYHTLCEYRTPRSRARSKARRLIATSATPVPNAESAQRQRAHTIRPENKYKKPQSHAAHRTQQRAHPEAASSLDDEAARHRSAHAPAHPAERVAEPLLGEGVDELRPRLQRTAHLKPDLALHQPVRDELVEEEAAAAAEGDEELARLEERRE
eukprot:1168621-Rhodomonas_salina.1